MIAIKSVRSYVYQKFVFLVARVLINNQWQVREFFTAVKSAMVVSLYSNDKNMKQADISAMTGLDRRTVSLIKKHGGLLVKYYGVSRITGHLYRLKSKGINKIPIDGSSKRSIKSIVAKHADQQITPKAAQRELIRRGVVEMSRDGTRLNIISPKAENYIPADVVVFSLAKYYEIHEYKMLGENYIKDLENDYCKFLGDQGNESIH